MCDLGVCCKTINRSHAHRTHRQRKHPRHRHTHAHEPIQSEQRHNDAQSEPSSSPPSCRPALRFCSRACCPPEELATSPRERLVQGLWYIYIQFRMEAVMTPMAMDRIRAETLEYIHMYIQRCLSNAYLMLAYVQSIFNNKMSSCIYIPCRTRATPMALDRLRPETLKLYMQREVFIYM